MAAGTVFARVITAALKRWAPKYVGAALKVLGVIEIADLAKDAWRVVFGDDGADEAAEGASTPHIAPAELVEFLRTGVPPFDDSRRLGEDVIDEEEVLDELERAERRDPAADVSVQIL